jgi:hypothetical protein
MGSFQNVSEIQDYFDFYLAGDYRLKHKILGLKKLHITNPRRFTVRNTRGLDKEELESIIQVFQHFAAQKLTWDTLDVKLEELSFYAASREYMMALLVRANSLGLFNRLTLACGPEQGALMMAGIELNKNLKALDIDFGGGAISQGGSLALSDLLETTQTLEELSLWAVSDYRYSQQLCQGLFVNSTLKKLSLNLRNTSDRTLCQIIDSLTQNPALQELTIHVNGENQLGDLCSNSLSKLLASSSSLQSLHLTQQYANWHRYLNTEEILQGIKANRSLKRLQTSNALGGDDVFTKLFRALPECPSLEKCHILESQITSEDMKQVVLMDRLPKSVEFRFDGAVLRELGADMAFEDVLRSHPEMRLKCYYDHRSSRPSLNHISRLNLHGRYLLDREPSPPLAVWPLVLEKVNIRYRWPGQETTRASLLYDLLKGPAFASQ